eukprot:1904717-Prorocentrum_lima.AAC.1
MTMLAKLVLDKGGIIAIEWPRGCSYWRDACVRRFVADNVLRAYDFDGCMYGIKTNDGVPMLKPWTIKTNCPVLGAGLVV